MDDHLCFDLSVMILAYYVCFQYFYAFLHINKTLSLATERDDDDDADDIFREEWNALTDDRLSIFQIVNKLPHVSES